MGSSSQFVTPLADLLVARFPRLASLSDQERQLLRLIEGRTRHLYRADSRLLAEGSEIRAPHFILSGWACRVRALSDGRRQIMSVLLPGDVVGLCARPRPLSLTSVFALSQVRTVEAPDIALAWRDPERMPGLSTALDLMMAEDEFFMLGHIMRLGRQTAYERMAHWFMELEYRLASRNLSTNSSFPFPLTQEALADVLGLSVVHVNRTRSGCGERGRLSCRAGACRSATRTRWPSQASSLRPFFRPRNPDVFPGSPCKQTVFRQARPRLTCPPDDRRDVQKPIPSKFR